MDPIVILLIAMAIVISGVLLLRLHAFLALFAGALVVAVLTPHASVVDNEIRGRSATIKSVDDQGEVRLKPARGYTLSKGQYDVFRAEGVALQSMGELTITEMINKNVAQISQATTEILPGDVITHRRDVLFAEAQGKRSVGARIATGFGDTCGKIGILIAMAAIIGKCLLASGAAERIVLSMRQAFGDKRTPLALSARGFVVGIPVFFDTVFYLLMPLARAMWLKTRSNYLLYVLAIVVGASMAHSLVPPTPGPLFVAGELEVNLGLMIIAGCVVGVVAVTAGYLYAVWANRTWEIPLRDDAATAIPEEVAERRRPSLIWALVPIVLPVILLSANTLMGMVGDPSGWLAAVAPYVKFLGDKNIALAVSALIALIILVKYPDPSTSIAHGVQDALLSAGNIVLITAGGGAFGHVLRQTGIAPAIADRFPLADGGLSMLLMAFGITAIVRVAQGSATVAMITAVGIVAPLVASVELAYNPVYVALAIGCGSKPMPWMNDSGFWVVTRMSGMTEGEALRTVSVALTVMGVVGMIATLLGAIFVPLV